MCAAVCRGGWTKVTTYETAPCILYTLLYSLGVYDGTISRNPADPRAHSHRSRAKPTAISFPATCLLARPTMSTVTAAGTGALGIGRAWRWEPVFDLPLPILRHQPLEDPVVIHQVRLLCGAEAAHLRWGRSMGERSAEGARPRLCHPLASPTSLGEATVHCTGHAPCVPSRPRSPRRACRGRAAVRFACVWGCVRRCDGRSSRDGPCLWCGGTRRLHLMPHVTCTYRRSTWLALCANRTCFTLARISCASQVCRSPDGRDSILSCSAA